MSETVAAVAQKKTSKFKHPRTEDGWKEKLCANCKLQRLRAKEFLDCDVCDYTLCPDCNRLRFFVQHSKKLKTKQHFLYSCNFCRISAICSEHIGERKMYICKNCESNIDDDDDNEKSYCGACHTTDRARGLDYTKTKYSCYKCSKCSVRICTSCYDRMLVMDESQIVCEDCFGSDSYVQCTICNDIFDKEEDDDLIEESSTCPKCENDELFLCRKCNENMISEMDKSGKHAIKNFKIMPVLECDCCEKIRCLKCFGGYRDRENYLNMASAEKDYNSNNKRKKDIKNKYQTTGFWFELSLCTSCARKKGELSLEKLQENNSAQKNYTDSESCEQVQKKQKLAEEDDDDDEYPVIAARNHNEPHSPHSDCGDVECPQNPDQAGDEDNEEKENDDEEEDDAE